MRLFRGELRLFGLELQDPAAVALLVQGMAGLVVARVGLPHLPQDFEPALAQAMAARVAAQSLHRAENYFGELYRRWRARLGRPKAITAMAHKLARTLWHLLKFKQSFNPEVFAKEEAKMKHKKLQRLHNMAESLNYRIVPIQ